MMAGNPNWWNMNIPPQPSSSSSSFSTFLSQSPVPPPLFQYPGQSVCFESSSPTTSLPALASLVDYGNPELPQSWSQLLLSELSEENNKLQDANDFPTRNLVGNWELEEAIILNNDDSNNNSRNHLKQEEVVVPQNNNIYCKYADELQQTYNYVNKLQQQDTNWSTAQGIVTTLSSNIKNTTNILDFSNSINDKKKVVEIAAAGSRKKHQDHSSNDQCNSSRDAGGRCKKPRVQTSSSTQSPLKVRKEKLGDRITALHQMVSPFGKTDTASVLLEAIGYIRFLQAQIEALSSPYEDNASGNLKKNPDASESGDDDDMMPKDLRSRGLCLVPVSCTIQVGNDSAADYYPAHAPFSGGF